MGKNIKNDKRQRNEKAAKAIKDKQSQKKKEQKRIKIIQDIRNKEKQQREEEKQKRIEEENERRQKEKEARKQERKLRKQPKKQDGINKEVKTKEQERKEFIGSIGNFAWYEKRVDAEIAEQKRREEYLKYVYDKYEPKLEEKKYRGR